MDIEDFLTNEDISGEEFLEDQFDEQTVTDLDSVIVQLKSLTPRLKKGNRLGNIDKIQETLLDVLKGIKNNFPSLAESNFVLFNEIISLLEDEQFSTARTRLNNLLDRIDG